MAIERMTYELSFFRGSEIKTQVLTTDVNRSFYDCPKEAAIDHVSSLFPYKDIGLSGFLPLFKSFRVLNTRLIA